MDPYLEYRATTKSTNDDVRARLLAGGAHGCAVYAGTQSSGRGRSGRIWHSPAGRNLYLSVGITEGVDARHLRLLPLAVAVATTRWLRDEPKIDALLKWPNDVLVGDRKLAGILCEGVSNGAQMRGAIVGVGVNLNLDLDELPTELRDVATSTRMLTGSELDIELAARALRASILCAWTSLRTDGPAPTLEAWRAADGTTGRRVRLQAGAGDLDGVADGVEADGALRVRLDDGTIRRVFSGEVLFLDSPTRDAR